MLTVGAATGLILKSTDDALGAQVARDSAVRFALFTGRFDGVPGTKDFFSSRLEELHVATRELMRDMSLNAHSFSFSCPKERRTPKDSRVDHAQSTQHGGGAHVRQLVKRILWVVALALQVPAFATAGPGERSENTATTQVREELWAIPSILPMLAYMIRPAGDGPFPLLVMNHGVSLDPNERSYFPVIEFRDAALWFAKQGYVVVAPVRPGYGATAIEIPERGLFGLFFSGVGNCSDANFRDAGLAIASLDTWVIDYMLIQPFIKRDDVVVVGQSGGGWGAIALASQNPSSVRAIIGFEAGRGGHLNGKPNSNCAPDRLVEAAAQFGRTARIPMLLIYTHNDSYFGPDLSMRLASAFQAAGGDVEYHLLSDFGEDGHFLIDSADAVRIWAPLVSEFFKRHR